MAHALGRPTVALGADGDKVVLGQRNQASEVTKIRTSSKPAIWGETTSSVGVLGTSDSGIGVHGQGTTRYGVMGTSQGGNGVTGLSSRGVGVYGSCDEGSAVVGSVQPHPGNFAIEAQGNIWLHSSGSAAIRAGQRSTVVHPNLPINAGSFVLLAPQVNLDGRDLWYTTNAVSRTITIKVSSPSPRRILVAWLLVG